jgi:hypothetical protein
VSKYRKPTAAYYRKEWTANKEICKWRHYSNSGECSDYFHFALLLFTGVSDQIRQTENPAKNQKATMASCFGMSPGENMHMLINEESPMMMHVVIILKMII